MCNLHPHTVIGVLTTLVANIGKVFSKTTLCCTRHTVAVVFLLVFMMASLTTANISVQYTHLNYVPLDTTIEIPLNYANADVSSSVIECNLLLSYPDNLISFIEVMPTPLDESCDWLYFDVSHPADNLIRISARAVSGSGNCFNSESILLASIKFYVTDDSAWACNAGRFKFIWQSCDDNRFVSEDGSLILVSDSLFDQPHTSPPPLTGRGVSDSCVAQVGGTRALNFYSGAIGIDCLPLYPDRGDINRNGISYEIADFVIFQNYFIVGFDAFGEYRDWVVAATEIDGNEIPLELSDLAYLHNVVVGDTLPLPKLTANDTAILTQDLLAQTLSLEYEPGLAALFVKFVGDITPTHLFDTSNQIYLTHYYDGTYTRVLIMQSFISLTPFVLSSGPLFSYTGTGNIVEYDLTEWKTGRPPSILVNTNGSCCVGKTGNINRDMNDLVDISDLTFLINYLFIGKFPLSCPNEANVDGAGTVDIEDLTRFIDYMFKSFTPLSDCP